LLNSAGIPVGNANREIFGQALNKGDL